MREKQHNPHIVGEGSFGRMTIVLLAALFITAGMFWQTRRAQLTRFRSQFESDAAARTALIMQEADKSLFAIKTLGWFFEATGHVEHSRFQTFAADCLNERKELKALSWNPRVSAARRVGFEQKARQEDIGPFRITERNPDGQLVTARDRETYYPVLYIEPLRGNESAVGFDVGSDAVRHAALERARDTGEPAATEPIRLVQQEGGPAGFLIFEAVYREGMAIASVEQRRAALEGFAVGVYQVETLVAAALRGVEPMGLTLVLRDRAAPVEGQWMYRWEEPLKGGRSWKSIFFPAPPRATHTFALGGRQWGVELLASPVYMERYCPISYWLALPAGLAVGLLAMGYLGAVLSSRERLAGLVAERTAELCQTQERLRLVLDAIPVRVHWKNRDSVYLGCNRRFAEDAEVKSPQEIVGKTDFDLPWKEYAELYRGRDRKVIESGEPMLDYEQPRRSSDGRALCLRQSKLPLRDAQGNIIGVLSTYEDITKRKQDEEALQAMVRALKVSEAKYRQLHKSMMDAFVAVDLNGRLTDCNETFRQMLGYGPEEITTLRYEDWTPTKWHALEGEIRQTQVLSRGYSDIYEKEYRRKDGTVFPVELRVILLRDDAGTPYGMWAVVRDITDRKLAEEKLRQSREQLRERAEELETIMGSAPVALWVAHDPQCNYISGNRMASSFDEASPQANWSANVAGVLRWFRGGRQLQPEELPMQLAVRTNREIHNAEMELLLQSGKRLSLLGSAVPLRDAQGRVRGCVGAFLDNTERKQAESLLAGEKRVLEWIAGRKPLPAVLNEICRFIEELSPGVMSSLLLLDPDGTRLRPIAAPKLPEEWTRAITPLVIGPVVGSCGAAAWGKEQVVVSDIAADPRWTDYPEYCALALKCGLRACWSTPILAADGELLGTFAMYYQEPRSPQASDLELIKQVTHLASVAIEHERAAEALRQSEERLSLVVEAAKIGTWDWDLSNGQLLWSPQCLALFGLEQAKSIDYDKFLKAIHPEDRERADQAVRTALETHGHYNVEMRTLWPDGSLHWVVSRGRAYSDREGRPARMSGAALDITGLKKAEGALRQARDELAQANVGLERKVQERTAELLRAKERLEELDRLKSQFLATMSHELRTPLNSIIGFTGILRQGFAGPLNEEQKKQLGMVFSSAKHLLSLINDLLDLSRIEAGKVELEHEPFNFIDVVNEVIQNLTPLAGQKNLQLVADLPGPDIAMVGDRKRCFQVLLNLANNAVKFTDHGEVKIIARTEQDKLQVCVADTGIGIKPEQMGMLFEAFRQLDGSAKRMYEGTGLGLHLCRRLLTLLHGEIGVESEFGKGSRFSFTVPRQIDSEGNE